MTSEALAVTDIALGLTETEASTRRQGGLGNEFQPPASRGYLAILRQNAYPAINGPLLLISAVLMAYGLVVEALLTAGPVMFNVVVGVVQETRAKLALDRIAILTRPGAIVVRDGRERAVDLADVVLGDLLIARRGDQIVVDGDLVGNDRVELDEAVLTGEADAVTRSSGETVRSGTAVLAGTARYVATRVGADTTANQLVARSRLAGDRQTPLQREVARAIWVVAGLVVMTGVLSVVTGLTPATAGGGRETLEASAVLITLVPQGLAIMLTVTYAAGSLRISRLGALVQRQRAIESMSRVDTLCIDKTGTLTTQKIDFAKAVPIDERMRGDADATSDLHRLLGDMAASVTVPDRTTSAITAALGSGARPLAAEVPFASDRRWSALRFADDDRALVMGAATVIIPALALDHEERTALAAWVADTAAQGHRVVLTGRARAGATLTDDDGHPALPQDLEPLALIALTEELRPDAKTTLEELAHGGVTVRVISGDDPVTVNAVTRRLGLEGAEPARSGPDLAGLDDDELAAVTAPVTRFGRVDPDLKARLVATFRRQGHYVAMIGDGVNDVLPLRGADLAVAMASGAPATRAAADLVLLGDAFAVLPRAVVEGRRILAAMQATLVLLLSRTFAVLLIVAGAAVLSMPFPITPRQNAILALLTVGAPLILLVLWVPPSRTPPRLLRHTLVTSVPAGIALGALSLATFAWSLGNGASDQVARTVLTSTAVFGGLGLLPLIRPPRRPPEDPPLDQIKPWALAAISAAIYGVLMQVPLVYEFYDLAPLTIAELAALALISAAWTVGLHGVRWALAEGRGRMGAPPPGA
ncbi:MAG: HAD-IC family P-type ATPase [Chloroflexota bacterium]|jgi:cation-transporting ATPase E|nr:HAD-IC family P-type ATPase [Chloroflexota bacterium]